MNSLHPKTTDMSRDLGLIQRFLQADRHLSETRKAFLQLEAMDISDFEIFNALASLFYERGDEETSGLLAEAAYKCFQKE